MSNNVTTTSSVFKTEDITFKNARRQSEIEKEIGTENFNTNAEVPVPVSLTPEQVKAFYLLKISLSNDSNEKRLYSQTIKWVDELTEVKKKLIKLEQENELRKSSEEMSDSID